MKTDIEIAQQTPLAPITEIAEKAGVDAKYVEQYGKYKAKIGLSLLNETKNPDGKLILVTANIPDAGGRRQNNDDHRPCRRTSENRKKIRRGAPRALARSRFRRQGRRCGGGYAQVVRWRENRR